MKKSLLAKRKDVVRGNIFIVLAEIREAIGCGDKPMMFDLPTIIKDLVFIAKWLQSEHHELKRFTAGFGKFTPCDCEACKKARAIFGDKK